VRGASPEQTVSLESKEFKDFRDSRGNSDLRENEDLR
jgi:hypothetical protein